MTNHQEKEIIKQIIDSVDVGIFIVDPKTHKIVEANPYLAEVIERPLSDIIGKVCHNFICPASDGDCPITDRHKSVSKDECDILNKEGKKIPVFKTVKEVHVNGKDYLLESFIDIRDYKESKDLLLKAYNDITEMEHVEHALREYKKVLDSTDDLIIILDRSYHMILVNDAFIKERNLSNDEIVGRTVESVLGAETLSNTQAFIDKAFEGKTTEFEMPYTYQYNQLGKFVRFLVKIAPIYDDEGVVDSVLVLLRDITSIVSAVEDKKRIFNMSTDIIAIGDFKGKFTELNPAWQTVLGWSIEESIGKNWLDLVHPEDEKDAKTLVNWLITGHDLKEYEMRYRTKSGEYRWIAWNAHADYDHQEIYTIGRDITLNKKSKEELYKLAMTDSLTGISNRRHFLDRFKMEIERSTRYNRELSYLTFDIDDFKMVNDRYGHDVGDETIITITKIGSTICRESDEFGRLGGEEFGILLPEIGKTEAANVARRLLQSVESRVFDIDGNQFQLTISIGLTELIEQDDVGSMMKRADKALYSSKDLGKNRVTIY